MLIYDEIEVLLNGNNIKHYESLGYEIPRRKDKYRRYTVPIGTKIKVKLKHLPENSNVKIEFLCDYCFEKGINKIIKESYQVYMTNKSKDTIKKDCCKKCQSIKTKESNLINYGVESTFSLESVQKKRKQTNLNIYGVENPMQNEDIKNKTKETNIEKYGVENPMKNEEIKEKSKETCLFKYGFESSNQLESVKEKKRKTTLKNFNVEYPSQNENVMKKIRKNINITMYKNGSAPCSKQQKYLHDLLNGELNFPIENTLLDIAFLKEKIYIEYDGSGHNLSVVLSNITQDEFLIKERNRYYLLKRLGWKMIRILSMHDKLPHDDVLVRMIKEAKEYLNTGHSWIKYDIDNNKVISSKIEKDYNFGELRKIVIGYNNNRAS